MTTLQRDLQWYTAIHEAGHVLGARLANAEVDVATIVPNQDSLGYVRSTTDGYTNIIIKTSMGHAAELEFEVDGLDGHCEDYKMSRRYIKRMLKAHLLHEGKSGADSIKAYRVWQKVRVKKSEWEPTFDKYRRKARRLAKKHRAYIEAVALLLLEKGTLTDKEIPQL